MTDKAKSDRLPALASTADVCAHLSITRATLHTWVKRGTFPSPVRPSGKKRGKAYWSAEVVRSAFEQKAA
jgi:predicted site-specific integrase-resolvase